MTTSHAPFDRQAILTEAVTAHQAGRLPAAVAAYERVLAQVPGDADALHYLGMARYQMGDLSAALQHVSAAEAARKADPAIHANLGLLYSEAGRLDDAARHLETALKLYADQPEAWHTLGLVRARQNRMNAAVECQRRALGLAPRHAGALRALGSLLHALGESAEAIEVLRQAVDVGGRGPSQLIELGEALETSGAPEEAADFYREAAQDGPHRARALSALSRSLRRRELPVSALVAARSATWADRASSDALRAVGQSLKVLGRLGEAAEAFQAAHAILRTPREDAPADRLTFTRTSRAKLRHDAEQLRYLRERALGDESWDGMIEELDGLASSLPPHLADGQVVPLPAAVIERIRPWYNRCHHLASAPRVDGPVLGQGVATERVETDYANRAPGITWIDDFLTAEALESLRRFCLESTIWYDFDHTNGYVGAYLQDGFTCPLLVQIAEELPRRLPGIFGDHKLLQLWAYKYDSRLAGIDMHADFAAVNVNFWITPTEATLDDESGGMVVWDAEAPLDWGVDEYNTYDPDQQQRIRDFLDAQGARAIRVPHRQNRCVVFNSDLFHKTDDIRFHEGYENRRINVTMLYGKREHA